MCLRRDERWLHRVMFFFAWTLAEKTNVHEPEMSSSRRQVQLVASFGFLLLMAVGVGCHGFFVDPTPG